MQQAVTTFAEHLNHFALSVGIVSDATFDDVRNLVVNYMRNELEAAYFGLMERTRIDNSPGLQTIWSTAGCGARCRSGAITTQIATKIARSRFGVCYFSERTDRNGPFTYADNPNVIFEAGMLHALINTRTPRRRDGSRCAILIAAGAVRPRQPADRTRAAQCDRSCRQG